MDCDFDRRWNGGQVYEASLNLAYHLIMEYGLQKGEVVCFAAPNSDIHAIALLAVIIAGGIYVCLPPLSKYGLLSSNYTIYFSMGIKIQLLFY